ncbi:CLIP%2C MHC2 interacting [Salmonella enterica subsp. enterica serovar Typhi]|nr:CLIP%2C MHC2 interacting [Salmonella enterica subsp. enterica serovar Typhi]
MDDQRDLISNHEQLPILGNRPREPERCSRGALYTGVSVLVALLLAGQHEASEICQTCEPDADGYSLADASNVHG